MGKFGLVHRCKKRSRKR